MPCASEGWRPASRPCCSWCPAAPTPPRWPTWPAELSDAAGLLGPLRACCTCTISMRGADADADAQLRGGRWPSCWTSRCSCCEIDVAPSWRSAAGGNCGGGGPPRALPCRQRGTGAASASHRGRCPSPTGASSRRTRPTIASRTSTCAPSWAPAPAAFSSMRYRQRPGRAAASWTRVSPAAARLSWRDAPASGKPVARDAEGAPLARRRHQRPHRPLPRLRAPRDRASGARERNPQLLNVLWAVR